MTNPRVTDNDKGEISVTLDGRELRGWSYASDDERRQKMLQAREYVEGWCDRGDGSDVAAGAQADNPTLWGQIAAVYGKLDAEDCAWIDREWAKMRGYILPSDGTNTIAAQSDAVREMWAMLYLHDWDSPKEGQEHRWEPGKNIFPEIHNVYGSIQEANAVLARMSDQKKYWVRRVWMPAHDALSLSRPHHSCEGDK